MLFKIKIFLIEFKNNKFIFENNKATSLIKKIDIDFCSIKILRIITFKHLSCLLQISQSSLNIDEFLLSIEFNINNMLIIDIFFTFD